MKIGLFFGSFNPIHIGHLIIANHIINNSYVEQIWFVISPLNPLKNKNNLLGKYDRLNLVEMAIEDNYKFKTSDIEFNMPVPSYTIDTLTLLHEEYPKHDFSLIMGGDNLVNIHKWKNYKTLIKYHNIIVYNRSDSDILSTENDKIIQLEAPMLNISASHIRACVKSGKSIKYMVPEKVRKQIEAYLYYK